MGKESSLWQTFKRHYDRGGHWVRIENSCELGTPDVNGRVAWCVDWWIELKYSKAWPKRPRTVVRLEHFTREQKQWLVDRGKVGGCCGVLWQVGSEYLFFDWRAAPYLGTLTRAELYECALWHGKSLGEEVFRGFLERGI
jgi:hypothetical protein